MTNNKDEQIVYPSITDTFEGIGKDFHSSIPHVILGKNDKEEPTIPRIRERQVIPPDNPKEENPMFNPKENDTINKIRKWAIVAAVLLVVGYAVYRIIKGFVI